MKTPTILAVFITLLGVGPATAQNTQLLGTARSIVLKSDVVFNKNNKFNSDPIPLSYIYRAGLLRSFREVTSNPDIIIKFHKDVFLIGYEKVSVTVFDPDDNSAIYVEERDLLDEENDVNRLVAHLLAKVKAERDSIAVTEAQAKRELAERIAGENAIAAKKDWEESDRKARSDAKVILTFYSPSDSLTKSFLVANRSLPNEFHVYLRDVRNKSNADILLEEKFENGIYILVCYARDTGEVLHKEQAPEKSANRAVTLMSKWITSTPWE
jgi:hypothetical protein